MQAISLNLILEIWFHISKKRKRQFTFLIFCTLLSAILESLTVALIFPFIQALSDPNTLIDNQYVYSLNLFFNINNPNYFILPLTIILGSSSAFSGLINIFKIWFTEHLTALITSDISKECFKKVISQSYINFSKKNSSYFSSTIINEIRETQTVIFCTLRVISAFLLLFAVFATLLLLSFRLTIYSIFFVLVFYFFTGYFVNNSLLRNSRLITFSNKMLIKKLQESFGNIKDIILYSNQKNFLEDFSLIEKKLRNREAQNRFLGLFTKYLIESIGIIIISAITCYLLLDDSGNKNFAPILGVLAFGSLKVISPIQQIYNNWAFIKSREAGLKAVLEVLNLPIKRNIYKKQKLPFKNHDNNFIEIKNLQYRYSKNEKNILDIKNIKIKKGETIGIIGSTGSGKSTLIDLIMGLLIPNKGNIFVNGKDIFSSEKFLETWQKSISHVPQEIYLFDSSIKNNITCTSLKKEFQKDYFNEVLEIAMLKNFIASKEKNIETLIGERGSILSGGQRQRLGIARALYRNSEVLIFDEATSALDFKTESKIIKNINNFRKNLTIIMVAHRLNTLKNCDKVIKLDKGLIQTIFNKNEFNDLFSKGLI
ncbi:ABC transporter ATP-binding protein [Prochlorococcus marinus]|uniref:ABC transporter ATP-binding protein n=1 Tax=Prochlorococcus marinus TaxID=1219 RepID=UPI001AD99E36|nr:ABC transporter ATP-binding protein [Prochlorococcus marinus]MBO8217693.1 ABC transporter ATP-binding protein [Prochlorococcus marinus XMU1405]MBW3040856.1 hypothetical protein [Prochlorococcus marinus str. MU1405]MBW3048316.1 hypothetical protein [Prochlorococcus marinus str. MU1406]